MEELRLQSSDSNRLILESQGGMQFQLAIDDSVRKAIRQAASVNPESISLTPREIQSAIRSGKTVEQLVQQSGDPVDYVAKFAQPVLDELIHVLSSALGVRISIAGDRYNDVSQTLFGDIIASRLSASGVHNYDWSTYRDENGSWQVVVRYILGEIRQTAIWSFDVKKLLLSPENDSAVALSTQNSLVAPPKLAPVESTPLISANDTAALPETQKLEDVIPIGRASERVEIETPAAAASDISKSKDLLDALKKKREERTAEVAATSTIQIVAAEPESQEEVELPAPAPSPIRRNGRPSIPSFDEIVQGTKSEDE